MLENHMVIGDYYPEPEPEGPDEDEQYERMRQIEIHEEAKERRSHKSETAS